MASTWLALRAVSAASRAVSLASVPELVKKTLAFSMPESLAIFSASSTWLRMQVQRRGVHHPGGDLPLDRVPDLGDVVAEHVRQDAGEEVEVAAALAVGDPAALAADDLDRLVVVDPDPVGDDRAMAGEKLRHAPSLLAPVDAGGSDIMYVLLGVVRTLCKCFPRSAKCSPGGVPPRPPIGGGGADRLGTPVRWVHAIELTDVARLLRGGELVLSTGIALPDDERLLAAYVAELADVGVAGLAVELGRRYAGSLPAALVAAAARTAGCR